jgi:hypothetical protein
MNSRIVPPTTLKEMVLVIKLQSGYGASTKAVPMQRRKITGTDGNKSEESGTFALTSGRQFCDAVVSMKEFFHQPSSAQLHFQLLWRR